MAQPPATPTAPDVNQTFLREVDENIRRDRVTDFFRDNKVTLIVALILFLGASGGLIWWESYSRAKTGKQVETLAETYKSINDDKMATVPARLDQLSTSSADGVRASALFTRAALALEKGDSAAAAKIYADVQADEGMPQAYRDAALIRQTALDFDKLKPDQLIARLAPFMQPDNPWYGSAAEMTAAALIKQGKKAEAGRIFAQIANDKNAPESLRGRSVQIAGSLGVDASGALTAGAR